MNKWKVLIRLNLFGGIFVLFCYSAALTISLPCGNVKLQGWLFLWLIRVCVNQYFPVFYLLRSAYTGTKISNGQIYWLSGCYFIWQVLTETKHICNLRSDLGGFFFFSFFFFSSSHFSSSWSNHVGEVFQFSSGWYVCSWKSPLCALHPISQKLKQRLIDSGGPFSFQI